MLSDICGATAHTSNQGQRRLTPSYLVSESHSILVIVFEKQTNYWYTTCCDCATLLL